METPFGTRRLTVIGPDWHQATVPANVFHLSLKRLPMTFWSSSAVYFEHLEEQTIQPSLVDSEALLQKASNRIYDS
jgi:hypothetical protein